MSEARDILKKYWGYDDFRGVQREIIDSICAGRDTLGLMPTGGGKSVTFQVPALMHEIGARGRFPSDNPHRMRSRGRFPGRKPTQNSPL